MWWYMPLTALKRLKQEDHTFEDNLNYIKRLSGFVGERLEEKGDQNVFNFSYTGN